MSLSQALLIPGAGGVVRILSISPSSANNGDTLDVVMTGRKFEDGAEADFGEDVTVNDVTVDSATQLTVNITVASDLSATGTRTLVITQGTKTATLADCLTVVQFYLLRDEFDSGAASHPLSTPRTSNIGTLAIVATDGEVSITDRALHLTPQTSAAWGDQGVYGAAVTRAAGIALVASVCKYTDESTGPALGFARSEAANVDAIDSSGILWDADGVVKWLNDAATNDYNEIGSYEWNRNYEAMVLLRATGSFCYTRSKDASVWTLRRVESTDATATLYPVLANYDARMDVDYLRVVTGIARPTPILSESFAGTAGTELNGRAVDGLGAEETGGTGYTWEASAGVQLNGSGAVLIPKSYKYAQIVNAPADGLIEVVSTFTNGTLVILFRISGNNFWELRASDSGNGLTLYRVTNGSYATVTQLTGLALGGGPNTLTIRLDGSSIEIVLNGNLARLEATDTIHSSYLGFYIYNLSTSYDLTLDRVNMWPLTLTADVGDDTDDDPGQDYDLYVANAGDDDDEGTHADRPYATLTQAITKMAAGKSLALLRGDVWREDLTADYAGITVGDYGDEENDDPRITAADLADSSGATQEDAETYPNVWRFSHAWADEAYLTQCGLIVDGELTTSVRYAGQTGLSQLNEAHVEVADRAAALAYVNDNANTCFYEYASDEHRFSVNGDPRADGKVREVLYRTAPFVIGESSVVRNIVIEGARSRNGAPSNNVHMLKRFSGVTFANHGGIHNLLQGGKYWADCISKAGVGGSGSYQHVSMYHNNSAGTNQAGVAFVRCQVLTAADRQFYSHDNPQLFNVNIDCEARGSGSMIYYGATAFATNAPLYVIGAKKNATDYVAAGSLGSFHDNGTTYVENVEAYLFGAGVIQLPGASTRFYNCRFYCSQYAEDGSPIWVNGKTGVDAEFDYCSFVIDYTAAGGTAAGALLANIGTCSGTAKFTNCNVYVIGTTLSFRDVLPNYTQIVPALSGTTANNHVYLLAFKAGTPRSEDADMYSGDPSAGDWTLSGTSPSTTYDIGWRSDRASRYRAAAEALAASLNV